MRVSLAPPSWDARTSLACPALTPITFLPSTVIRPLSDLLGKSLSVALSGTMRTSGAGYPHPDLEVPASSPVTRTTATLTVKVTVIFPSAVMASTWALPAARLLQAIPRHGDQSGIERFKHDPFIPGILEVRT